MARGSLERGRGRGLKFLRAQAENSGPSINSFERGSEWRPWKKSEASLILSSMVGAVSTCVVAAGGGPFASAAERNRYRSIKPSVYLYSGRRCLARVRV